jgi:molecular chaperone GrpE
MSRHSQEKQASGNGAGDAARPDSVANEDGAATQVPDAEGAFQADHEAFLRLADENRDLNDRLLRMAADMENLRKRTARDVHDARAYAISAFARDMLSVSDNLRRALDAIPQDALNDQNGGLKALAEGVEMTAREMLGAFERHGVRKLDPKGGPFDPNFHQAVFEVPNAEVPANTVVEVIQEGYVIGERVLRPAMVGVSRGGPKETGGARPAAEPGPPDPQAERDA